MNNTYVQWLQPKNLWKPTRNKENWIEDDKRPFHANKLYI